MNAEKRYKDRVEDVAEGVKKVAVQAFEAVEIHLQRLEYVEFYDQFWPDVHRIVT